MEKIYTIPVNEAFEQTNGCPFCALYDGLEEKELDGILGAAMMEPDVRQKTNEKGFCPDHFEKLYARQKRLPLALILESHLQVVQKELCPGALSIGDRGERIATKSAALSESCYVCEKIEFHFSKMLDTACYLYENDRAFRDKLASQRCFCVSHYGRFLSVAHRALSKKRYAEFTAAIRGVEEAYLKELSGDVSKFCQKFDYRFAEEPWGEEKSAVERSLALFGVRTGEKKK